MMEDNLQVAFYGIDLHGIGHGLNEPSWGVELVLCWDKKKLFSDPRMRRTQGGSLLGVFTLEEVRTLHESLTEGSQFEEGSLAHESFGVVQDALSSRETMFVVIHGYLNL